MPTSRVWQQPACQPGNRTSVPVLYVHSIASSGRRRPLAGQSPREPARACDRRWQRQIGRGVHRHRRRRRMVARRRRTSWRGGWRMRARLAGRGRWRPVAVGSGVRVQRQPACSAMRRPPAPCMHAWSRSTSREGMPRPHRTIYIYAADATTSGSGVDKGIDATAHGADSQLALAAGHSSSAGSSHQLSAAPPGTSPTACLASHVLMLLSILVGEWDTAF